MLCFNFVKAYLCLFFFVVFTFKCSSCLTACLSVNLATVQAQLYLPATVGINTQGFSHLLRCSDIYVPILTNMKSEFNLQTLKSI